MRHASFRTGEALGVVALRRVRSKRRSNVAEVLGEGVPFAALEVGHLVMHGIDISGLYDGNAWHDAADVDASENADKVPTNSRSESARSCAAKCYSLHSALRGTS